MNAYFFFFLFEQRNILKKKIYFSAFYKWFSFTGKYLSPKQEKKNNLILKNITLYINKKNCCPKSTHIFFLSVS